MIEPEIAFADLADDCALAEDFLRYLVSYALEHCTEDLAFFNERVEPGLIDKLEKLAAAEFRNITYTEAVAALKKRDGVSSIPWNGASTCSPSTSAT